MENYGFTLSGVTLPGGMDPMGLWEVRDAPPVSYAAPAAVTLPQEPTWRAQLPASLDEAAALLQAQAHIQALAGQDLARIALELERLTQPALASFSSADPLAVEKSALLAAVDRLQTSAVSYSISQRVDPEEQETVRQWDTFVAEIRRMVTHYAHIHTTIAGTDVGLTTVSWTGDFATHWVPGSQPDAMPLHIQAVQMALDSRLALIRVASVVVAGAAGLIAKAAVPGGQLLLLPAAWRFVRDVLRELRQSWPQLQNLTSDEEILK